MATGVTSKVTAVAVAGITTEVGTVAAAVLPLLRVTVKSSARAKGMVTVATDGLAEFSGIEAGTRTRVKFGNDTVAVRATVGDEVRSTLVTVILPVKEPAGAAAETRTLTACERAPSVGGRTKGAVPKTVPSDEISKPLGGVTVTLPVRLVPVIVNDCAEETWPKVAKKGKRGVPVSSNVGVPAARTVPLTATFLLSAPALERTTLPENSPATAEAAMRT